jgi:SnoaL-like domain
MEQQLQRLLDIEAIKDVHARYCRGIDRMDWDIVRGCYHPEAIDDHGPFKGGLDDFIDWVADLLPGKFATTTHFSGQQIVEVKGDKASMESYSRAYHRQHPAADGSVHDWILNLRYIDELERRNGEWRFVHRLIVCDSEITLPVRPGDPDVIGETWHRGTRDKTDGSYIEALPAAAVV